MRIEREKWGLYVLLERRIMELPRDEGRRKVCFILRLQARGLSSGSGGKGVNGGAMEEILVR